MRTYLDCVPCFIRQAIDSARRVTDALAVQEQLLRETLSAAAEMAFDSSPPAMGQVIHRRLRELTGLADPYLPAKQQANDCALHLYPELKQRIARSEDPFTSAVKVAIAGNVIDLGVKSSLTEDEIHTAISGAMDSMVDDEAVEELRQAIIAARDVLYLADNAGEIVFDRLLIEQMPLDRITVVVKGSPVINDATFADAKAAGLPGMVRVIDNGSDAPGTILDLCSDLFRRRIDEADLVIAKGQGNYETLSESHLENLFFLLKVKCPVLARDLGCPAGRMVVCRHRAVTEGMAAGPCDDFDWAAEEAHS